MNQSLDVELVLRDVLEVLRRHNIPVETASLNVSLLKIEFGSARATQSPDFPHSLYLHSYRLGVDCLFSDDAHADYNELDLAVTLQQREATEYPRLRAWVGWLVNEESGGDWGLDIVYDAMGGAGDYAPHQLGLLQKALPSYFKSFGKRLSRHYPEKCRIHASNVAK